MSIKIAIIMGSQSDWEVMKNTSKTLKNLDISHESRVISAHRTPDLLDEYIAQCEAGDVQVIIAGAGLSAALPGVIAAKTIIPVVGVPLIAGSLDGMDALMSIVQMPPGIPVGTVAIGKPGAINSALYAAAIMAVNDSSIKNKLIEYRATQAQKVIEAKLD
ncbi:5-(carboxyamino)imidazole ribonucleotide mutase [Gammaproteobacteria bacterium]|jgi:5-(carboxyamino)imidazole ribonucleotide mutase|nr:5-(carboxyamino)imidazole ribonucleotide mutase [Gammaproteobacteria bacterium]|tara:strand:- start:830 stop:1312 length:483 start_codon:yes stop_codon:yes gene_type:complete